MASDVRLRPALVIAVVIGTVRRGEGLVETVPGLPFPLLFCLIAIVRL